MNSMTSKAQVLADLSWATGKLVERWNRDEISEQECNQVLWFIRI